MRIDKLALRDFRSYEGRDFTFSDGVNIISGENGVGKTNLLEGIFLLTGSRSWRALRKGELLRFGTSRAVLSADVFSRSRDFEVKLDITPTKTACMVNNVKLKKQCELSEVTRCVLFSPEDLYIVKGGAAERRRLMDTALCQLRPRYSVLLQRYMKLLDGKQRLLRRENTDWNILPEYNAELIKIGAAIISYRAVFCRGLNAECPEIHSAISGGKETLELKYKTVSSVSDPFAPRETLEAALAEHLESHRQAEIGAQSCLCGVHRDDILIDINGKSAKSFGSQGQTRSAALALKFGERRLFFRDSGEYPILLLDDVLSELDGARQDFVAQNALGGQTIITCCEHKSRFEKGNIIEI